MQTQAQLEPQVQAASPSPRRKSRCDAGGSLVELLIVVAILLVVLAMALPRLMAARQSAQQAAAVVFLRNLHAAQEQFRIVNGNYAGTFAELDGFLADSRNANGRRLLPAASPVLHGDALPALAFLLLPAMSLPDEPAYSSDGPQRPKGSNEHRPGAGTPRGDAPRGSNPNPPGKNRDGDDGGADGRGESNDEGADGHPQSSSSSSHSAGGSEGADWSKADRITYQGYEFHLLRLTAHTWRCLATPVGHPQNAHHYFADQGGTIRREFGRPAGPQSPLL